MGGDAIVMVNDHWWMVLPCSKPLLLVSLQLGQLSSKLTSDTEVAAFARPCLKSHHKGRGPPNVILVVWERGRSLEKLLSHSCTFLV